MRSRWAEEDASLQALARAPERTAGAWLTWSFVVIERRTPV
jgi:hypothetical protein